MKITTSGILGDVDGNGRVDIIDALLVAMYSVDSSRTTSPTLPSVMWTQTVTSTLPMLI